MAKKGERTRGTGETPTLTDLLQTAIRESGKSLTQIEKDCELGAGQLSRFMRGERTITLPVAEKILHAINKEAVLKSARKPKGGK